jgi:hypothetical protein
LTYLEVKGVSISVFDTGILFVIILLAIWLAGYIDDLLQITYKELVEHGRRFNPYWSPDNGYFGVKFLQMEADIQTIKDHILTETTPQVAAS